MVNQIYSFEQQNKGALTNANITLNAPGPSITQPRLRRVYEGKINPEPGAQRPQHTQNHSHCPHCPHPTEPFAKLSTPYRVHRQKKKMQQQNTYVVKRGPACELFKP